MELILLTGLILGFFIVLFGMFLVTVIVINKKDEEDFAPTMDDEIDNFFMISQANDN